jgi:phytoene dehydrogenase-like protein
MHNVSLAFASYLQSQGNGIRTNAGVERFLVSSKRVTGVRLQSGEEITVNQIVVSSVDPGQLVLRFLGEKVVGSEIAGKMKR